MKLFQLKIESKVKMKIIAKMLILFAKAIYPILEKLITVTSVEKREKGVFNFLIRKGVPGLNLSNDADYLIYKQSIAIFSVMTSIVIAITADAIFSLGFLVDQVSYQSEPKILAVYFRDMSIIPWLVITTIFYIRIRLSLNMSTDNIPININSKLLGDDSKGNWVIRPIIIIAPFFVLLLYSYAFVFGVLKYFSVEQNILIIVILILFLAMGLAGASLLTVMKLLMLEKAYSHYPDLSRQLFELSKDHRSSTSIKKKTEFES
ncbi:hypothetical protein [Phenylobacterium sp.]|uniref:hypothetical protein n=1 Tax=Phenylobacterium sp. TaxID=1871053 RepID=UPI002899B1BF|nr:hypothetical protein [Phenylobacterium sp.]